MLCCAELWHAVRNYMHEAMASIHEAMASIFCSAARSAACPAACLPACLLLPAVCCLLPAACCLLPARCGASASCCCTLYNRDSELELPSFRHEEIPNLDCAFWLTISRCAKSHHRNSLIYYYNYNVCMRPDCSTRACKDMMDEPR